MNKKIFDKIYDPEKLLEVIAKYRSLDLKNISLDEVEKLFSSFFSQFNLITVNLGCKIFRVRKIKEGKNHSLKNDLWFPPPVAVKKMNRLNDVGESIFYAALDPITAIKENHLLPDDDFSLSVYDLKPNEPVVQSTINIMIPPHPQSFWSKSQKIHSKILSDFLFTEFTRPVSEGAEYQYKASCVISKLLLEIPYKDSFLYPSTTDYSKINFAIEPNSAEKRLELRQVLKCKLHGYSENNNPIITVAEESIPKNNSNLLEYCLFNPNAKEFELKCDGFFKGIDTTQFIKDGIDRFVKK
ncbi:MAG: hypothetical protein ABFQ62_01775 [Patescibacteria group bacterium]